MVKLPRFSYRIIIFVAASFFIPAIIISELFLQLCKKSIFSSLYQNSGTCSQLRQKYTSGADSFIYIPQTELRANGRACGDIAFVAQELPVYAKSYVTLHEGLHLSDPDLTESQVNYLAAKKEPLGLVQTVLYSLARGLSGKSFRQYPCLVGSAWLNFKVYFLGYQFWDVLQP